MSEGLLVALALLGIVIVVCRTVVVCIRIDKAHHLQQAREEDDRILARENK